MSRLIESIRLLDGKFANLSYHQQRIERSLTALYGPGHGVHLETMLSKYTYPSSGLYKCRIVYDDQSSEMSLTPYSPLPIRRVRAVEDNDIVYEFKFEDRSAINRIFEQREDCDDVLIVRRGLVTDCSFSNIVFRKGRKWYTPHIPLLKGTMRQQMIDKNIVTPREIHLGDIRSFETFKIINAMLEFDSPEIEVSDIVF